MEFDFKGQFKVFGNAPCLVAGDTSVSYQQFATLVAKWEAELDRRSCRPAQVVAVCGDFSSDVCALIFALAARAAIIVPLSSTSAAKYPEFLDIAQMEAVFTVEADASWHFAQRAAPAGRHPLFAQLERGDAAGLILFSSGSTGQSKASLLNFGKIAARSRQKSARAYTTLAFLLLDHMAASTPCCIPWVRAAVSSRRRVARPMTSARRSRAIAAHQSDISEHAAHFRGL